MTHSAFEVIATLPTVAARSEIDSSRIFVLGLSFGGFYALLITALCPDIRGCISSGYVSDPLEILRRREVAAELYAPRLDRRITEAGLIGLLCPRPCFVESDLRDELRPPESAEAVIEDARSRYGHLGISERFDTTVHADGHQLHLEEALAFLRRFAFKS